MSSLPQFDAEALAAMAPDQLRALTAQLLARIEQDAQRAEQANQAMSKFSQQSKQLAVTTAELSIQAEGLGQIISAFGMASNQVEGAQQDDRRTSDS